MNENTYGMMACQTWGWKDKLRFKLFPVRNCELPPAPHSHLDVLTVNTVVKLPFVDRIRLLVSGEMRVDTKTVTQNEIGEHVTGSSCYVLPIKILNKQPRK